MRACVSRGGFSCFRGFGPEPRGLFMRFIPGPRLSAGGGASRASHAPAEFITRLIALSEPPLLSRSCRTRARPPPGPAARRLPPRAARARTRGHTHVALRRTRSHSFSRACLTHTRALPLAGALPLARALPPPRAPPRALPLALRSASLAEAQAPQARAPRGPTASPWLT